MDVIRIGGSLDALEEADAPGYLCKIPGTIKSFLFQDRGS